MSTTDALPDLTTKDADLFTIIDSFDQWTRAHGMSLTIDYHQYGTLLDKRDPTSLAIAVQLWAKVAEHIATNPREDLFLELLNEPELSFVSGAPPTAAEWGTLAERMIAAIRATDQKHTILFGDVQWYAIAALIARTPLSDPNIIHVFHNYDPFLFTSQGASWTGLGSAHDIPYPYDPSRWSQYYADLGLNSSMASWILNDVQNYYRDGSRAAIRNVMVQAKQWAITHNVPVVCNEFGSWTAAPFADRVRYYTDVIDIFGELNIPWQHWYMVMDANGVVAPELRTAMHLGQ